MLFSGGHFFGVCFRLIGVCFFKAGSVSSATDSGSSKPSGSDTESFWVTSRAPLGLASTLTNFSFHLEFMDKSRLLPESSESIYSLCRFSILVCEPGYLSMTTVFQVSLCIMQEL